MDGAHTDQAIAGYVESNPMLWTGDLTSDPFTSSSAVPLFTDQWTGFNYGPGSSVPPPSGTVRGWVWSDYEAGTHSDPSLGGAPDILYIAAHHRLDVTVVQTAPPGTNPPQSGSTVADSDTIDYVIGGGVEIQGTYSLRYDPPQGSVAMQSGWGPNNYNMVLTASYLDFGPGGRTQQNVVSIHADGSSGTTTITTPQGTTTNAAWRSGGPENWGTGGVITGTFDFVVPPPDPRDPSEIQELELYYTSGVHNVFLSSQAGTTTTDGGFDFAITKMTPTS